MREKNTLKSSLQTIWAISTVLWILSHLAQWHNVLTFRTSRTAGTSRKHPGKHKHFKDDPLACWHTSGMAGTLAQYTDPWHRQTNDDTQLSHSVEDSDGTHRWCGWFMVDDGVYGDDLDDISESEQAENQSKLRKLTQPHKLKINPNFEIWTNLEQFWNNLENFVSFYDRAFSWHLGGTSMCNIWELSGQKLT